MQNRLKVEKEGWGGGRKGGKSWGGIRGGDIKVKGWIDKGGKEGSFLAY